MADDDGYLISEVDVKRIAKVVQRDERRLRNKSAGRRRGNSPWTYHTALALTTSAITARALTLGVQYPGQGTATVWELGYNASDVEIIEEVEFSDRVEMTIYNAGAEIAEGAYLLLTRDRNGNWWANPAPPIIGAGYTTVSDTGYVVATATDVQINLQSPTNYGGVTFTRTGTQAITVPLSGVYRADYVASISGSLTSQMVVRLYRFPSGTPTSGGTMFGQNFFGYSTARPDAVPFSCCGYAEFSAGEHIGVVYSHSGGSNNTFTNDGTGLFFARVCD